MARSSRTDQMEYLSLPRQYQPGNGDSTFCNGASATNTPIVTAAQPFSTEYSFCDPRIQHDAALFHANFTWPSTIDPVNLEDMDNNTMQGFFAQLNSTAEGPGTDYHCLVGNNVAVPCLGSTSSAQQPTPPKDSGIPTARGHRNRSRRTNKQEDPYGSFECRWIDCKHPGPFCHGSVLMRHIKTQHVNPRSIDCPRCKKTFNRKDNMKEHLGRVHREYI
ncbi:hypothetical protein N7519_006104 [Penicillium mononematosum]|uniref:uncharacterized protein n=1 Tax=Penicillium mononematosum TaxID=268346 RepID=UPI0025499AD6|nr:uncharacterized protein N7519_006104 [Penicillium mononematosum]KAJ6184803.1 hypothetical protein N7519_006104 [Penicillium mononematosum]